MIVAFRLFPGMRLDSDRRPLPATLSRRDGWIRRAFAVTVLMLMAVLATAPQVSAQHPAAESHAQTAGQAHGEAGEGEHEPASVWSTVAKIFNFAVLAGVLFYFMRAPVAGYLETRGTQIRQDLVTAAEMRATATAQLAEIDLKLKALPAELDALRTRGAEDVVAERGRIEQAAVAERERLLEHTRREIQMQLRVARRSLVEHAAQLAVDVARTRITNTVTHEDQLRLVDRYAAQLKEAR